MDQTWEERRAQVRREAQQVGVDPDYVDVFMHRTRVWSAADALRHCEKLAKDPSVKADLAKLRQEWEDIDQLVTEARSALQQGDRSKATERLRTIRERCDSFEASFWDRLAKSP